MEREREVAGLRFSQALAALSQCLAGELEADASSRLEEHVRGCDRCRRFGEGFSAAATALKAGRSDPDPLDEGVAERLRIGLEARL